MDASFVSAKGDYVVGTIDVGVYGLEPILKTAHAYTGRCFVHLQHGEGDLVEVRLRARHSDTDLQAVFGEFANDVLDHCLRVKIAAETEGVRNLILAHALSGTSLIAAELETVEPGEDPVGIGRPDSEKPAT